MLPHGPLPLPATHMRTSLAAVAHAVWLAILDSTATAHIHHECAISGPHYDTFCCPGIEAKVYGQGSVQG